MDRAAAACPRRFAGGLLLLAAAAACAPQARPAGGPVAEAVGRSLASGRAGFDHAAWGRLLAAGTRDGLVDYRALQARRGELDAYLEAVAGADLGALSPGELMALLANAYNALTVRAILDHPEVKSSQEIPGVWTEERHRVGGYDLTLDDIEHGILRPFFKDPRIHFALNCAARSCAPLPPWALEGRTLDAQLERLRAAFIADPRYVRVEAGRLRVSRLFDWYVADFVAPGWKGAAPSLTAYLRAAASPDVAALLDAAGADLPIDFLDYDWALNAAAPPDGPAGG